MSAVVRPAEAGDAAAVADLLHARMNARIPPERWRRLLDYPWRPAEGGRGWLVEDGGRVVGYMGTILSDRELADGRIERFCDLSSWYLLADYRGDGTGDALLRAGMADPGVHYATMTARRATGRKIRGLGFSVLDETQSLFSRSGRAGVAARFGEAPIADRLDPRSRRIAAAHAGLNLHHGLFEAEGRACHLVWQRKLKGEGVAFHDVLFASDTAFLSRHAQGIADALLKAEPAVLAIDSRFMRAGDDPGLVRSLPLARWYRSPARGPIDFDHLYSEVLLLDQKLP